MGISLSEEKTGLRLSEHVIEFVTARVMKKVRASDYEGALADWFMINPGMVGYANFQLKGFILQERGIAKLFVGDLQGALEDLTAALEVFSKGSYLHCYKYKCWKHRCLVNSLLSNVEGAQKDGAMALNVLLKYACKSVISTSLGDESVMHMHFKLKSTTERNEEDGLKDSSHSQVMEKVRASEPHAALALWEDFSARVPGYHDQGFFLQERGIMKRLSGDLHGALEDLTTALEIYDSFKNRGYVKYFMGDLDGAQKDGVMAVEVLRQLDPFFVKSGSLEDELVTFMHLRLKGMKELSNEKQLVWNDHCQVMEKVWKSDFLEALAIWEAFDAKVSGYHDQFWFLQERGVLKRLLGDLRGALQDVNTASAGDPDDYGCSKHRGYVKYLLGAIEGAQIDAERCLAMGIKEASDNCLGTGSVSFLGFNLLKNGLIMFSAFELWNCFLNWANYLALTNCESTNSCTFLNRRCSETVYPSLARSVTN